MEVTMDDDTIGDLTDQEDIGGSGYSLDDLSAYLDAGRTPFDPAIEHNAECRSVLTSLEQVGRWSRELLADEAQEAPSSPSGAGWMDAVLGAIAREVRSGRDIAYPGPDERTTLSITEGAVRSLIRAAGDEIPGVLIGRSRIDGPLDEAGEPVTVTVTISVRFGYPLPDASDAVRTALYDALARHTPLTVGAIDVVVDDVRDSGDDGPGSSDRVVSETEPDTEEGTR
jgi:uncharacterized alkaline shock family protein YloU